MKKTIGLILGLLILLLIIGWYYWGKVMERNIENEYAKFYNSDLDGVVEVVRIKYHGSSFKLKGNHEEYIFYPYTNATLNDSKVFNNSARKGDRIIKPAQTDTLFLLKGNKTYKYTFKKSS